MTIALAAIAYLAISYALTRFICARLTPTVDDARDGEGERGAEGDGFGVGHLGEGK